jgi:hypothetical protein
LSFGEDLEDELGGAVGEREVAQFVEADEFGAGVAADDAAELAARVRRGDYGARRWTAQRPSCRRV